METYTLSVNQLFAIVTLSVFLLVGFLYLGFCWGWQKGYEHGWEANNEWAVRALVEIGATLRPEKEDGGN